MELAPNTVSFIGFSPKQELPVTQRNWSTQRWQVTPAGSTNDAVTFPLAWYSGVVK